MGKGHYVSYCALVNLYYILLSIFLFQIKQENGYANHGFIKDDIEDKSSKSEKERISWRAASQIVPPVANGQAQPVPGKETSEFIRTKQRNDESSKVRFFIIFL